jgi:hypothetical protein
MRTLLVGLLALALAGGCGTPASCAPVGSGDLFYTRYLGTPNVEEVHYSYDHGKLTLGKPKTIATLNGVDGIAFAPDGDLLVGGQGDVLHKVHVSNGKSVDEPTGGASAYHVVVDPSGKRAWASGIPGSLAEFPLDPFRKGTTHEVKGDDNSVTTLAWDGSGDAFYTDSGSGGNGDFGRIDLKTFTTRRAISGQDGLHGMAFDAYTGLLVTFGGDKVLQIDPKTEKVVSELEVPGSVALDQGTVNGSGYVYVASNNGQIVFVDYSKSKRVGDKSNAVAVVDLESNLDDVAPPSGPGAKPCG